LVLSLALGCLAFFHPRLFPTARYSRFLIGVCITPYVIGIWMKFAAIVMPSGSRWFFISLPFLIALIILSCYTPQVMTRIKRFLQKNYQFSHKLLPIFVIYLCALFLIGLVTSKIVVNGNAIIQSHDSLVYLTNALDFANERTYESTLSYLDDPEGNFRGTSHSFIFSAFLSHALLHTDSSTLGYPNDHAARWAFQVTIVYMFLAMFALALTFRTVGVGALSLILLLQVSQLEYISYASSRDAFRVIPLILFTILLASLTRNMLNNKLRQFTLIPLFILSAFSLMGHTLGGIVVVMVILSWLFWVGWWNRKIWRNIILINLVIILGLLIGGLHYVDRYLKTNSIMGESTGRNALIGTPLEYAINPSTSDERLMSIHATKIERLTITLGLDQGKLSIPGLLFGGLSIIFISRFKKDKDYAQLPFIGGITFTIILPFSGLMDLDFYELSRAFSSNIRYSIHWYPFLAICISALVLYSYNWLLDTGKSSVKFFANMFLIVLSLLISYSSYKTIDTQWRILSETVENQFANTINEFNYILATMPKDKKILMNDGRYSYYLGQQVMTRFAKPTWPVTRAKNEEEVQLAISELNIGAVMLNTREIEGWWDQLPLYSYLNNTHNTIQVYSDNRFQVYRIIENEFERTLVIQACIEKKGCNVSLDTIYEISSKLHPQFWLEGYTILLNGNWNKVEEIFERAIHEFPEDLSLQLILSKAYKMQGKTENLYSSYRNLLSITKNSKHVIEFLAAELSISPDDLLGLISKGELYQSPIASNVAFNFLDEFGFAHKEYLAYLSDIRHSSLIVDGLPKGIIFQHPPTFINYELVVPPKATLVFFTIVAPEVWQPGKGDGVQFEMYLQTEDGITYHLYDEYIDPKNLPEHRQWLERQVNLSRWGGETVTISFVTGCGPNDDCRYDWAGWGEPRILQSVYYDFLDNFSEENLLTGEIDLARRDELTIAYETRPILFQHPTSQVVYNLTLPQQPTLKFGLGMDPQVWQADMGDGVEYSIYVRSPQEPHRLYQVFNRYLDPKNDPGDRMWFDEQIDLSRFGGQQVDIIFEALPGPADDYAFDWGGWSTPVIIDDTLPGREVETGSIPLFIGTSP
jgi:tetratricopeptide (TPR) repeat protein